MMDRRTVSRVARVTAICALSTLAALFARATLAPWLGFAAPMMVFLVAVFVSANLAGLVAGLLTTIASAVVATALFLPDGVDVAAMSAADRIRVAIFLALGIAISLSSARLARTRGRLRAQVERTQEALAARDVLLQRECAARDYAEELVRIRDEFAATLSHELRTPANAILGYAVMLRGRDGHDPKTTRALEAIERNARLQAQLIDDVLDLGRILSGRMELDVETVDLRGPVQRALDVVSISARAKGVEIDAEIDAAPIWIAGDAVRLQQVAWNVLSNAVKFTDRGGHVEVRLQSENGSGVLEVSDTGHGIAADYLPFVFDRFRQQDGSMTRAHGGLGIGLAATRHLVELHGGVIEVTSEGRGLGAHVRIRVPLTPAPSVTRSRPRAQVLG